MDISISIVLTCTDIDRVWGIQPLAPNQLKQALVIQIYYVANTFIIIQIIIKVKRFKT